jgi:hypothetical protein
VEKPVVLGEELLPLLGKFAPQALLDLMADRLGERDLEVAVRAGDRLRPVGVPS